MILVSDAGHNTRNRREASFVNARSFWEHNRNIFIQISSGRSWPSMYEFGNESQEFGWLIFSRLSFLSILGPFSLAIKGPGLMVIGIIFNSLSLNLFIINVGLKVQSISYKVRDFLTDELACFLKGTGLCMRVVTAPQASPVVAPFIALK